MSQFGDCILERLVEHRLHCLSLSMKKLPQSRWRPNILRKREANQHLPVVGSQSLICYGKGNRTLGRSFKFSVQPSLKVVSFGATDDLCIQMLVKCDPL